MIKYLESPSESRKGITLCGISGSGKTQLIHEYVARRRCQFSAVLWIDAGSEMSIDRSMSFCFSRICEAAPGFRDHERNGLPTSHVLDWLQTPSNTNWLVVIDGANDPMQNKNLLEPFRRFPHGSICVTSTHKAVANILKMKQVLVERLDKEAAQSLLLWNAFAGKRTVTQEGKL